MKAHDDIDQARHQVQLPLVASHHEQVCHIDDAKEDHGGVDLHAGVNPELEVVRNISKEEDERLANLKLGVSRTTELREGVAKSDVLQVEEDAKVWHLEENHDDNLDKLHEGQNLGGEGSLCGVRQELGVHIRHGRRDT